MPLPARYPPSRLWPMLDPAPASMRVAVSVVDRSRTLKVTHLELASLVPLCLVVLLPTMALAANSAAKPPAKPPAKPAANAAPNPAASVPDMKGDWVGTADPIVSGKGGPHWPENKGTWDKPVITKRPITIHVTAQDGKHFWGHITLAADQGTGEPESEEPFIASFSTGGPDFYFADTDGYAVGGSDGQNLSYCYMQAGAKKEGDGPAVVACADLTKK